MEAFLPPGRLIAPDDDVRVVLPPAYHDLGPTAGEACASTAAPITGTYLPTPLGHSLAGYAAARLTGVRIGRNGRQLFAFAAIVSILPDLLGKALESLARMPAHGFAHSFVAMALVSGLAAAAAAGLGYRFWPVLAVVAAVYSSHLLADLLRPGIAPSQGEQLFWPFPGAYAIKFNLLPHIPERPRFGGTAAYARVLAPILARELLLLGPLALLAHWLPPRITARAAEATDVGGPGGGIG